MCSSCFLGLVMESLLSPALPSEKKPAQPSGKRYLIRCGTLKMSELVTPVEDSSPVSRVTRFSRRFLSDYAPVEIRAVQLADRGQADSRLSTPVPEDGYKARASD